MKEVVGDMDTLKANSFVVCGSAFGRRDDEDEYRFARRQTCSAVGAATLRDKHLALHFTQKHSRGELSSESPLTNERVRRTVPRQGIEHRIAEKLLNDCKGSFVEQLRRTNGRSPIRRVPRHVRHE